MVDFHMFGNMEELSLAAATLLLERANQAVKLRGRFIMALSGGSTPKQLFRNLAADPFREEFPWDRTVVLWGDDRAVGPDHEWSNYRTAQELLLSRVSIPESQIFRILGELGAERAAEAMLKALETIFGTEGVPRFDVLLQGIGKDGHTASLFPGTEALTAERWVTPVFDPPANPTVDRVSLTFTVLNAARLVLFLAAGEEKRTVVQEIMHDPSAGERYPAACVDADETVWFVDEAAFGKTDF